MQPILTGACTILIKTSDMQQWTIAIMILLWYLTKAFERGQFQPQTRPYFHFVYTKTTYACHFLDFSEMFLCYNAKKYVTKVEYSSCFYLCCLETFTSQVWITTRGISKFRFQVQFSHSDKIYRVILWKIFDNSLEKNSNDIFWGGTNIVNCQNKT